MMLSPPYKSRALTRRAFLGATTAPALAATRGWNSLVTPGVLVGVLGYALGTFIGTVIFKLWS